MVNADYKKDQKDLYLPKQMPMPIDVPAMNFIMIDGKGSPDGDEYQSTVQTLYSLSYTIKMSKKGRNRPSGYFEYVVPPLEGLWWCESGKLDLSVPRSEWSWTAMIRQPEFVTDDVFKRAVAESKAKKPEVNVSKARFAGFTEGLCVQIMHIGPYEDESRSIELIDRYISENGLENITGDAGKHHEIYLSDPRKTDADSLRTVIRIPVRRRLPQ